MITHQVFIEPSAIAVGLPEEQAVLCIEVFGRAGLRVHRADPDAACERMTKLLPQIIVVTSDLDARLREMIDDRAVAVGAVIVALHPQTDFATLERMLDEAVETSRRQRGRKPRSA